MGNVTSFQYNGSSTVDYCIVSSSLLKNVRYFNVSDLTVHSDHCQINVCLSLCHTVNNIKIGRRVPKGIRWNKNIQDSFQKLMVSDQSEKCIYRHFLIVVGMHHNQT